MRRKINESSAPCPQFPFDDHVLAPSPQLSGHVELYAADVQRNRRDLSLRSVKAYLELAAFAGRLPSMSPPPRVFQVWVKAEVAEHRGRG